MIKVFFFIIISVIFKMLNKIKMKRMSQLNLLYSYVNLNVGVFFFFFI